MNAVICYLVKFLVLLKPSKDTLYDVIFRDYGRRRLKDVFSYIENEKKTEKCILDIRFLTPARLTESFVNFYGSNYTKSHFTMLRSIAHGKINY